MPKIDLWLHFVLKPSNIYKFTRYPKVPKHLNLKKLYPFQAKISSFRSFQQLAFVLRGRVDR